MLPTTDTNRNARFWLGSAISGVVWCVVVAGLLSTNETFRGIAGGRWTACLFAPLIGLALGVVTRFAYGKPLSLRIACAVGGTFLGACLFGWTIGLLDPQLHERSDLVKYGFLGTPLPLIWGLVLVPPLWSLFVVSYWNQKVLHSLLRPSESNVTIENP
jgi:hypothetical protein